MKNIHSLYSMIFFLLLLTLTIDDIIIINIHNNNIYNNNVNSNNVNNNNNNDIFMLKCNAEPFFYVMESAGRMQQILDGAQSALPTASILDEESTYSSDFYNALQLLRIPRRKVYSKEFKESQVLLQPQPVDLLLEENNNNNNNKENEQKQKELKEKQIKEEDDNINDILSSHPYSWLGRNETDEVVSNPTGEEADSGSFLPSGLSLFKLFSFSSEKKLEDIRSTSRRFNLPRKKAKTPPTHGWKRFFIALNLYKNEDMIPFLTGALVAFIEDELAPFFNISSSVVVSIFTNDSRDRTGILVEKLLIPALQRAGVKNIFATVSGTCLTYIKSPKWMSRIEWMACVRNKALEPLYVWGMRLFSPSFYTSSRNCENENGDNYNKCLSMNLYLSSTSFGRYILSQYILNEYNNNNNNNNNTSNMNDFYNYAKEQEETWEKDIHDDPDGDNMLVLFFNDIFFQPHDITTLMESVVEPIIASRTQPDGTIKETEPIYTNNDNNDDNNNNNKGTTFDMACGMDFYYSFYDTWVSRDRRGAPFAPHMPYTDDIETRNAFQRIISNAFNSEGKRQAVPVKCCWNGVAAIRGRLFIAPLGKKYKENNNNKEKEKEEEIDVEISDKIRKVQREIRLWGSRSVYRISPDAHKQAFNLYFLTLLKRLSIRRRSWADRVRRVSLAAGFKPPTLNIPISVSELRPVINTNDGPIISNDALNDLEEVNSNHYIYYRSVNPGIRFRHSVMPSFGAIIKQNYNVRDDVCVASECLLICQDIMQAALLEKRAPVILMNPNIRVAYEPEHFDRITGWIYNSPFIFKLSCWIREIQQWFAGPIIISEGSGVIDGTISSDDDWTISNSDKTTIIEYNNKPYINTGKSSSSSSSFLLINITRFTWMTCYSPDSGMNLPIGQCFFLFFLPLFCVLFWRFVTYQIRGLTFPGKPLRRYISDVIKLIRWHFMRALLHPRGNFTFGCPRLITIGAKYILGICNYRQWFGYELVREEENNNNNKNNNKYDSVTI